MCFMEKQKSGSGGFGDTRCINSFYFGRVTIFDQAH